MTFSNAVPIIRITKMRKKTDDFSIEIITDFDSKNYS